MRWFVKTPIHTVLYQDSYVPGKETVWDVACVGLDPAQARRQGCRIIFFHEINQWQVLHSGYNTEGKRTSIRKSKLKKVDSFADAWRLASKRTPAMDLRSL